MIYRLADDYRGCVLDGDEDQILDMYVTEDAVGTARPRRAVKSIIDESETYTHGFELSG
jgi:hypothetical protein